MTRSLTPFSYEFVVVAVNFIVLYATTGSQFNSLVYFIHNLSLSFSKHSYCLAFSLGLVAAPGPAAVVVDDVVVELLFVYFLQLQYNFCCVLLSFTINIDRKADCIEYDTYTHTQTRARVSTHTK